MASAIIRFARFKGSFDVEEICKSEWSDPENWSDGAFQFYFCKRDDRVWVPKQQPWQGWTLNIAHRHAGLWLIGIASIPFFSVVAAWVIVASVTAG